jgi:hypothetical protein
MRSTLPSSRLAGVAPKVEIPSLLFIQKMLQRHHHGYDQWADAHGGLETPDEQDAMMQKLSEPEEIARSGYSSRRLAL